MATLRNKRKLAAVTRETQEENPRNGQSRNTSVPRINEEYITQVFGETEGRVSKKLSQEFSRTESRILGALTKLDEFISNQQIHAHFETVPETFRNTNVENQGTNEDDSQSDPHPETGIFGGQATQNLGPKDCRDNYRFFWYVEDLFETKFGNQTVSTALGENWNLDDFLVGREMRFNVWVEKLKGWFWMPRFFTLLGVIKFQYWSLSKLFSWFCFFDEIGCRKGL